MLTTPRDKAAQAYEDGAGVNNMERLLLEWQYKLGGEFRTALWHAIEHADDDNLHRISLAFPHEVSAVRAWRTTWVRKSLLERGFFNF